MSSMLLVSSGYLSLYSVIEYGAAMLVFPVVFYAAMPFFERIDRRFPLYRQMSRALQVAYIFFIPYTYLTFGRIDALLALIIFIQAYTLLHLKTPRNYYHLYLMAFFMLLTAVVQSPEPMIALVMGLFLISAVWSLAALRLEAESHQYAAAALNVAGIAYETGGAAPSTRLHVGASVVSLITAVFVLTVGLFLFTPRIEAGLFGRDEEEPRMRTGLNDRVNLRNSGLLQEDTTAVMHVVFPEVEGGYYDGPLYWRSTSLAQYVGGEWARRGLSDHLGFIADRPINPARRASMPGEHSFYRVQRPPTGVGRRVRQQIFMDNVPEQGLPCLDLVQEVALTGQPSGSRIQWDPYNDFTVVFDTRGPRRVTYDVWSETVSRDPAALRDAPDRYDELLSERDFLLLTDHDLRPETIALAEEIIGDASNAYDKAVRIEQWLSGDDFLYTMDLPPLPARNPIDAFIGETRRGHCELFGSALALMLRSQGIPARVVTGFRDAEWDAGSQAYIVRARNAHLWVEILFPGHGWVIFDPSPRVDPSMEALAALRQNVSRTLFELKMFWYENVLGYESSIQISSLRDFSARLFRGGFDFSPGGGIRSGLSMLPRLTAVALAVVLVWAVIIVARALHGVPGRRYVLTGDQVRAVRLYRRALRRTRKTALLREGKTAEELAALIAEEQGAESSALAALQAYNEVRFGQRPLSRAKFAVLCKQLSAQQAPDRVNS